MLSSDTQHSSLDRLEFIPYLNDEGRLPQQFAKQVGLYAIFDEQRSLQFVGYSRDVLLSLKQHLIRCPQQCRWVKVETVERPSRTVLEGIRDAWIAEYGAVPPGNGPAEARWTQPVDAKTLMTADEKEALDSTTNELEQSKLLKKIARRVEAEILAVLNTCGLEEDIRFDPKLKEQGLLNVKP